MSSLKYAHGHGNGNANGNGVDVSSNRNSHTHSHSDRSHSKLDYENGNGNANGALNKNHTQNGSAKAALHSNNGTARHENGHGHGHSVDPQTPLGQVGNTINPYTYEVLKECADFILARTTHRPKIGIICGSGLGGLADLLQNRDDFPYSEIPHFPTSTVSGHEGKLVVGELSNVPVVCMKGRFHFYEGYPLWKVSMPVRVFKLLGIETLLVTNAAGGLNSEFKVGDIMLIKDHFNFPGFGGDSPLRGVNDERFGPRFPPLNSAYDVKLRSVARKVAHDLGFSSFLREGVYTMVGGPSYETVAELKAMKLMGIDAVGMSTIPEVIVASHCGIKTLAFSLITNECITDYDVETDPSHAEVIEAADAREADLKTFVSQLIPLINQMH